VCFQYQTDTQRFEQVLVKRLAKFALTVEPSKIRPVAAGRLTARAAKRPGKRRETLTFLGVTLYCPRKRRGTCKVGGRTAKSRGRRRLAKCHQLLQIIRHEPRKEHAEQITPGLRGPYAD
jgi:hypothetical protein